MKHLNVVLVLALTLAAGTALAQKSTPRDQLLLLQKKPEDSAAAASDELRRRIEKLEAENAKASALLEFLIQRLRFADDSPSDKPQVSSPTGGTLNYGDTVSITWSGFPGSAVDIDLMRGNLHQQDIVTGGDNDGSLEWTVPVSVEASDYRVIVRDADDASRTAQSAQFSIQAPPPAGEVSKPAAGDSYFYGDSAVISWTGLEGDVVKIDLRRGPLATATIADGLANTGSYVWTVPSYMASSDYTIVVRDLDNPGERGTSGQFAIGPAPQTAEVTSPTAGQVYFPGDTVSIQWTGFTGEFVKLSDRRTTPLGQSGGTLVPSTENDGHYNWTIPTSYLINRLNTETRILMHDLSDTSRFASSAHFEIGKPAQSTAVSAPVAGASYQHHDTLEIAWSGFAADTVTLKLRRGNVPEMTIDDLDNDGSHQFVIPSTPDLEESSEYRVVIYNLSTLEVAETGAFTITPLY